MIYSRPQELLSADLTCGLESVDVHCLTGQNWRGIFAPISAITAAFTGLEENILHDNETKVFSNIRAKSYREAWLAGRVLAKHLYVNRCVSSQNFKWKDILIVSRNSSGRAVPPRLFVNNIDTGFMFSLSHVADGVMVVVPTSTVSGIGCDLVYRESTTPGIVKTFFHESEINDGQGGISFDVIWAVKEAAYKSCNNGEAFQPRQWLTQRIEENRFFCRHLDSSRQLFAEAETFNIGDYIVAVAEHCIGHF